MSRTIKWNTCASGFLTTAFHPSGTVLVSSSEVSEINCYDRGNKESFGKPEVFSTEHTAGIWNLAVSNNGNWVVSCGDDQIAYLFNYKNKKLASSRILDRCESSLFAASFSFSNDLVATAGGDGTIKIHPVNSEVNNTGTRVLKGHEGAVLTVAFDPLREFLASCGTDGTFRVWKLDTNKDKEVASLDIISSSGEPKTSKDFCRMAWSPDGKYIAVPTSTGIHILERPAKGEDWAPSVELTDEDEQSLDPFCVCWSPNSQFLASGHSNGSVFLWEIESSAALDRVSGTSGISSLSWNTERNELLIACDNGQLGVWPNILDQKKTKVTEKNKALEYSMKQKALEDLIDDEAEQSGDGHTDEESGSVRDSERDQGSSFIDDSEVLKVTKKRKVSKEKKTNTKSEPSERERESDNNAPQFNLDSQYQYEEQPVLTKAVYAVQPLPKPFQVNSSNEEDSKRYLVWNGIGKITSRFESNTSVIKIEFTNIEKYKTIPAFTRNMHISHAALSENAFVLASSTEKLSSLEYQKFHGSWAANTDWSIAMPTGETIEVVAICSDYIAVSTSKYLRIFEASGLQVDIIGKQKGPIVTMVGQKDLLCVVRAESAQKYHFDVYKMGLECYVTKTASLLLSDEEGVEIAWVGFTESGNVAVMDNLGVIQVLKEKKNEVQSQWYPVLDTSTKSNGVFWIIKMDNDKVIYVSANESTGAPTFIPPPIPNTMELSIPIIPTSNTKDEEKMLRNKLFLKEDAELVILHEHDKKILELYVNATRQDKCERALALANRLIMIKSFVFAVKVAQSSNLSFLASRVNSLKNEREEELQYEKEETTTTTKHQTTKQVEETPKNSNRTETNKDESNDKDTNMAVETVNITNLTKSPAKQTPTKTNLFSKATKASGKRKLDALWT